MISRAFVFRAVFSTAVIIVLAGPALAVGGRWVGQLATAQSDFGEIAGSIVDEDQADVEVVDVSAVLAAAPVDYLVDRYEVLASGAATARADFLKQHAEDSKIPLYVYVFVEGAVMPSWPDAQILSANGPVAVVVYFIGSPQRAGLYLSQPLVDVVSEAEQRRSLQSSVMQAAEKADPEEQLEAFLVQMSIRLYWMERMMDEGISDLVDLPASAPMPVKKTRIHWPGYALLAEYLGWVSVVFVMIVLLPLMWWVIRARRRYRFPEFEVESRLGGRHAAGVGGVISYLSASVPPAAQREQTADDVRRR